MPHNTTDSTPEALSPEGARPSRPPGRHNGDGRRRTGRGGPETVHRWLRHNAAFIAALNAGKADIVTAARAELDAAAEAVARPAGSGSAARTPPLRAADSVQGRRGGLEYDRRRARAIGPTDPADAVV